MKKSADRILGDAISKMFVTIMAIITLFPFVYMILTSLMTFQEATLVTTTSFVRLYPVL